MVSTIITFPKPIARFLSVLLHPVFVPSAIFAFLVYFCPSLFIGVSEKDKTWWLITMSYSSIVFPLLTVFLLWRLKFIDSMNMPTAKERLGPLIASMLFYFWVFWLFHKQFQASAMVQTLLLGVFLTTVLSFMATIFFKISLHASAWGGIAMFSVFCIWQQVEYSLPLFIIVLLLAAIIGSSRLALKEHNTHEIFLGFIAGIIGQTLAYYVVPLI